MRFVGHGRFGKLLANTFTKHSDAEVKIFARNEEVGGEKFLSLEEVAKQDIVVPCVPISRIRELFEQIKPMLSAESTVLDIASVKVYPAKWASEVLGDQPYVSTHPLFGPDSTKNGQVFEGRNMMMHNVSASEDLYESFKSFWQGLGVTVVEITPDEHDKMIAYTMNYNHLIGRIGERVGIKPTPLDTPGFKAVYKAREHVVHDTPELFADMQIYNPYAKEMRDKVKQAMLDIEKNLEEEVGKRKV